MTFLVANIFHSRFSSRTRYDSITWYLVCRDPFSLTQTFMASIKPLRPPPPSFGQSCPSLCFVSFFPGCSVDPKWKKTAQMQEEKHKMRTVKWWRLQFFAGLPWWLKFTENVSFNIASEASYVYILSGQKFIKNAKNGQFWLVFVILKLAVKQCYKTRHFLIIPKTK